MLQDMLIWYKVEMYAELRASCKHPTALVEYLHLDVCARCGFLSDLTNWSLLLGGSGLEFQWETFSFFSTSPSIGANYENFPKHDPKSTRSKAWSCDNGRVISTIFNKMDSTVFCCIWYNIPKPFSAFHRIFIECAQRTGILLVAAERQGWIICSYCTQGTAGILLWD